MIPTAAKKGDMPTSNLPSPDISAVSAVESKVERRPFALVARLNAFNASKIHD